MQAAYHAEALGSGTSFLGHAHLVPRAAPGSSYPFGYHNANYGDGSNAQHLFLPAGYNGVTPGSYSSIGADAAAAAVVQPQAYALPGFNYASPFTSLTTPLLNAVQSSLVSASSNAASEMQQVLSSPGPPSGMWAPENTPGCSDNGFTAAAAGHPNAQQPYPRLPASALQQQQQQQDPGAAPLGPSAAAMPGFPAMLAPGGYSAAVDVWKHLAMVAATGGGQSATPLQVQPAYGTDYQLPYMQQQQQQAATAALQMQAAYLQQQQQQQQQQQAYAAAGPAMASLGAVAAASLGAVPGSSGQGLPLGAANLPPHVLQFMQQQQQQQQQQQAAPKLQQQQQPQPLQPVVTPESLSDPALAAAAATALHLLQLPAGLRALAACGMMPHLLQSQPQSAQQQQQPQALQLPGGVPVAASCYGPGILAALLPPLAATAYTPCDPLAAAARAGLGQLPFQQPAAAAAVLPAQPQPRPVYPVQGAPPGYTQEGLEVTDPRLQHFQLLQQQQQQQLQQPQQQQQQQQSQQQQILQQQPSQTLQAQAPQLDLNPSPDFPEQQQRQQQSQGAQAAVPTAVERPGAIRPTEQPCGRGASPSAKAVLTRRESLGGSLSAPSPGDKEPYTEETSSPSPTRERSSAPSAQATGTTQPTSAALLILSLQQQQQQHQQQLCAFPGDPDTPPTLGGELGTAKSPRKAVPTQPQGLPPPQLLHFAGMQLPLPLPLPLPHAVLACKQPALSCPPAPAKGLAGTSGACTSTSAPASAADTRRRTAADRRERRKESNRESARRCRLRREKDTSELSRRVTAQETINGNMANQLQRLEQFTSMLADQNNVLEAWLKHIQSAGEGASAAAATILGYVRTLDEQMAAAAAAQLQQAVVTQGSYPPGDPLAMLQMQPKLDGQAMGTPGSQQQQQLAWPDEAAMAAAGAAGVAAGLTFLQGGDAATAALMRGPAAAAAAAEVFEFPGARCMRGSAGGSTSPHPAGGRGGAARSARMIGVEVGQDDEAGDEECLTDDDDDEDDTDSDMDPQM